MKITHGAAVTLLAAATMTLAACGGAAAETAAPPAQATPAAAPAQAPTAAPPTTGLENGGVVFGVSATGSVAANQDADLTFQVNGTVGKVLVEEGNVVKAGQVLAELDVRSFDQRVRDAEAALVSARADVAALTEDPTSEEAAAAQAAIGQAQGQYAQTAGAVTDQDITAAAASIEQAQSALTILLEGAKPEEIQRTTAQRDGASAQLEQTRNALSQSKTQSEIALQQATVALQQSQTRYSEAYWDWQYAQNRGRQPSDVKQRENPELSDSGTQAIYNRFKQAELDLQNAEHSVDSVTKQLEQARLAEVDGIAIAQKNLQATQSTLDLLLLPPDADRVAAAQAQVAQAQANLERLQGGERNGQLAAAAAGVASAQARYEQLFSDPTASSQTRAEANVARAEASLAQEKLNREYAEIRAPFAGEVAVVNIDPGDTAPTSSAGGQAAIRIVDTSLIYVEVDVSDADIARVKVGQKATITADALPGQQFPGTVSFVSPTALSTQNVTTFRVKIKLDNADSPLRIGMSVTAALDEAGQQ